MSLQVALWGVVNDLDLAGLRGMAQKYDWWEGVFLSSRYSHVAIPFLSRSYRLLLRHDHRSERNSCE